MAASLEGWTDVAAYRPIDKNEGAIEVVFLRREGVLAVDDEQFDIRSSGSGSWRGIGPVATTTW